MVKTTTLKILLTVVMLAGCSTEFRDGIDDTAVSIQSRARALQAWTDSGDLFDGIPHTEDFGKGFRDGHYEIAMGGDGSQPALPPREYRELRNRGDKVGSRLAAYMDGHEHGVLSITAQSRLRAKLSWNESRDMYDGIPHLSDFRRGYLDGFFTTSMGRRETRPVALPAEYSKRRFETALGLARVRTYRDGHQHGTMTAEAEMTVEQVASAAARE